MPLADRLLQRVRGAPGGTRVGGLLPERWTALRPGPGQTPPAPREFASFGANSWIVPPARVAGADAIDVGDGVVVMEYSSLRVHGGRLVIGDGVRLARFVTGWCALSVTIEPEVSSSDSVVLVDTWGRLDDLVDDRPDPWPAAPIVIEQGAYLGAGSIVGPGVRVGRGTFVGENAVVLQDVAPHSVVYGNPARVTRRLDAQRGWVGEMFP
jgi:acetyltransferase-like isoleucine patch superfamily enzyme